MKKVIEFEGHLIEVEMKVIHNDSFSYSDATVIKQFCESMSIACMEYSDSCREHPQLADDAFKTGLTWNN